LAGFLEDRAIEKVILPVVMLHQLAEQTQKLEELGDHQDWGSLLKEVTTTGEQLQITKASATLLEKLEHVLLHNHYGPSETHVVTTYTLEGPANAWPTHPPIGRPIANTQTYILDKHGQPVPIGVVGELCIGGVSLARGYMGRADLTAERFVPHPYAGDGGVGRGQAPTSCASLGERLYKTGDLARYLADGNIEYLGRRDNQVKLRGYRIELGEIESVLDQHPGVRAVACVPVSTGEIASQVLGSYDEALERQLAPTETQLVAYVVLDPERPPTSNDLRRYLQAKLPPYMVPSSFVMLDTLPLTPNGKVDRRALKMPDSMGPEREVTFVSPRTPAEEVVAEIWAEILHVEQVGVYDNFFALGGHSLRAVQVISRLRDAFQIELPVHSLFEQPTVDGLVSEIAELRGGYPIIEEIALVLKEIKQLSEEDMQDILNK
jgi:acyl-coenzyme A synthetase/AMP-(fatty) acid ligase/acyl carrier protein